MKLPPPAAPEPPVVEAPIEIPVAVAPQKRGWIVGLIAGITVLLLAGGVLVLKHFKDAAMSGDTGSSPVPTTTPKPITPAPVIPKPVEPKINLPDGLSASAVQIEKAPTGNLKYAVGVIKNESTRQRFGVKVELELFDNKNVKLGVATDYQPVIEPQKEWRFRALVLDAKAVSVKLAGIKEDQ